MRKLFCMAVSTALIIGFYSCKDNDEDITPIDNRQELRIDAGVEGQRVTYAPISAFSVGSSLGLFISTSQTSAGDYYENALSSGNIKSTYTGSSWTVNPSVKLSAQNGYVFAYYPYLDSSKNGAAIPIDHTSQTDFMYGTHAGSISKTNVTAHLKMKHALALLQFKIHKKDYPWTGKLTKIEVANAAGKTTLFSAGTLDVTTGNITNQAGKNVSVSLSDPVGIIPSIPTAVPTDEKGFPKLLVLPVNSVTNAGDLVFHFTIDDLVYTWAVPANTKWEGGTKNTYTVTVSGHELIIGSVTITEWTDGPGGAIDLE